MLPSTPAQDGHSSQGHRNKSFVCCLKKFNISSNSNGPVCQQKYSDELKILFKLAWPMCLSLFLQSQLMLIVVVLFCGHLGGQSLAIITLTLTFTDILGNAIAFGLMSACDTLFAQTFGSANKKKVGIVLQRSLIILYLFCVATSSIYLNAEPMLLLLHISPENARISGICIKMFIVCLPAEVTAYLLAKYLECQGIVIPSMIMGIIVNSINVCGLYILIHIAQLGVYGAVLSVTISYYCLSILYIVYILNRKIYKDTWSGFSSECILEWGMFLKLAIPGAIMICIEWWSFEILALLAGVLGEDAVAAQGVLYQVISFCYMWPLGIANASSIRIGNLLGAGRSEIIKTTIIAGLTFTLCTQTMFAILMVSLRYYIGALFTNDSHIIGIVSETLPVLAIITVCDAVTTLMAGVVRGSGQQKFGAINNFIGYYCIGIPIGLLLMYRYQMGVRGLWLGLIAGALIQAIVLSIVIYKRDWVEETRKARIRAGVEKKRKTGSKDFRRHHRFFPWSSAGHRARSNMTQSEAPLTPPCPPAPVEMVEMNGERPSADDGGFGARKDSLGPLIHDSDGFHSPRGQPAGGRNGGTFYESLTEEAPTEEAYDDEDDFIVEGGRTPPMRTIVVRRVFTVLFFVLFLLAGVLTSQLLDLTRLRELSAARSSEGHGTTNFSTTATPMTLPFPVDRLDGGAEFHTESNDLTTSSTTTTTTPLLLSSATFINLTTTPLQHGLATLPTNISSSTHV